MCNNRVRYVYGVNNHENVEVDLLDILDKKLDERDDKKYLHKNRINDMKLISLIQKKTENNEDLSVDEIKFLYELERDIKIFGNAKDLRIAEIKKRRSAISDINRIFRTMDNYDGDLELKLSSARGLVFPKRVKGNFILKKLKTVTNCKIPEFVGGSINMPKVTKLKNVVFGENVLGNLNLDSLKETDCVIFPHNIGSSFNANELTKASSTILPKNVCGNINIIRLIEFENSVGPYNFSKMYLNPGFTWDVYFCIENKESFSSEVEEKIQKKLLIKSN